jgi:hypothetical protein
MWPRLLAQLLELLPHITHLVPLADKYLQSKSGSDQAHQAALSSLAQSHARAEASLNAKLELQAEHLAQFDATLKQVQAELTAQTLATNQQLRSLGLWIKASGAILFALLITLIALVLKR